MPLLSDLFENLANTGEVAVSGVNAQAAAFIASGTPDWNRLVVITPDAVCAARFAQDLSLFLGGERVYNLPPAESTPYEGVTPDPDSAAQRLGSLAALRQSLGPVVLSSTALLHPVPSAERLEKWSVRLSLDQELDRDDLIAKLSVMGYRREAVATQTGEMAVRGGIVDVFPPASDDPVRVELWDDRIHSLRTFDVTSQRSGDEIEKQTILPVTELILAPEERDRAAGLLFEHFTASGTGAAARERFLSQFRDRLDPPGIGLFLPLLFGEASYPADYFPDKPIFFLHEFEETRGHLKKHLHSARRQRTPSFPVPERVYSDGEKIIRRLSSGERIQTSLFDMPGARVVQCLPPLPSTIPASRPDRITELVRLLEEETGEKTVLLLHSTSSADRLQTLTGETGRVVSPVKSFPEALRGKDPALVIGTLSSGFFLPEEHLRIISDADLFGLPSVRKSSGVAFPEWDLPIGSLTKEDIVVHVDHGIGRYLGLKQLRVAGAVDDFLHLTFSGGDSLYVPVWQMNRVQGYRSASDTPPPLSKLGGSAWRRSKARIRRTLRLMAQDLLKISAARQNKPGYPFPPPDHIFREFEMSFPWTETPDQERTILEVISDMTAPTPMDRLVCGDVGFGKTEVALRAAFLASAAGKQTAVLVPTTVLAQQHFQNFSERLKDFPVNVGLLSRFVPPATRKSVLSALAQGQLDIVIGTHRLLSGDVVFRDLGLAVIDEEHRFGVRHKEKLKKLRETVDVLTMSATPIPRTLFQAFSGLRNLSLIHTPPADRKSVHTEVRYFEKDLIRDAISRELDRGGQIFFVHNRVQSIAAAAEMVRKTVPHARVGVAHGQMGEKQLEEVMVGFLNHDLDVLVTTAIIESGLDITNANTLIINRADRFGLAQLYQLRGRVGRSHVLAHAYLLVPSEESVTKEARQRLRSLKELTELGSGFRLASYDLEMRGAGNLLGEEQSGRIESVGLELFSQLLEQAVREAAGQETGLDVEPVITLPVPAYLPEEYLPDVGERLTFYKRLATARDLAALEGLREEAADRFGRLPPEVAGLFLRIQVQIIARDMGVERIDTAGPFLLVGFHPQAKVSPDALVSLLTSDRRLTFVPPVTLKLDVSGFSQTTDRVGFLMDVLRSF